MNREPGHGNWKAIDGRIFDWRDSEKPESPYNHRYHETLTMKLAMAVPDGEGGCDVAYTFADALELVKKVDALTLGSRKIMYLVGWQYNGHDDKYPAFFEVNQALKRPGDCDARASFTWLFEESKKFNTTVSVHINLTDAYEDSPLWDEYVENDLISRNANGRLKKIGTWNGRTAYQVCYKNEWESGYLQKRISKLVELLPFLKEAGTIHVDAFFARTSPHHGISIAEEESYMRRIYRYFSSIGMDLTSEFLRSHRPNEQFIGLQPMAWWFDQNIRGYLDVPATIACGGKPNPDLFPNGKKHVLAGFLFGSNAHGEPAFSKRDTKTRKFIANPDWVREFTLDFFLNFPQFYYLNQLDRIKVTGRFGKKVARFSGGVEVRLKGKRVIHDGCILREGNTIFFPALWRKTPMLVAFSERGRESKKWQLPPGFAEYTAFMIYDITVDGLKERKRCGKGNENVVLNDHRSIEFRLDKGQPVALIPKVP
ncbi:MAG: endo-alpha-N-acetylgalactosaminidase family protein [Promethearchaeota archaeon]